jgi:hypothetical protein
MFEDARPGGKAPSCGHFPCTPEKAERDHPRKDQTMTYTPGPWTAERRRNETRIHRTHNGKTGLQIAVMVGDEDYAEVSANARLIAAAPAMLEALKLARIELDDNPAGDAYQHIHNLIQSIEKGE